jgi:hypothetical protein
MRCATVALAGNTEISTILSPIAEQAADCSSIIPTPFEIGAIYNYAALANDKFAMKYNTIGIKSNYMLKTA